MVLPKKRRPKNKPANSSTVKHTHKPCLERSNTCRGPTPPFPWCGAQSSSAGASPRRSCTCPSPAYSPDHVSDCFRPPHIHTDRYYVERITRHQPTNSSLRPDPLKYGSFSKTTTATSSRRVCDKRKDKPVLDQAGPDTCNLACACAC